jgi:hypothetical protein
MNKIKALLDKLPFNTTQLSTIAGMTLLMILLIILKPFKGIPNTTQFLLSFFLIFSTAVIMLQIFFKKNTDIEKKIITGDINETAEKKKQLKEKGEEVVQELQKKTVKAKQTKNTINKLKEEKEELKTGTKKEVDVKSAAKKLKNL